MVIKITNEEYNMSVEFWDTSQWLSEDIYINKHDIDDMCQKNAAFWLLATSGLASGNKKVSNSDASAINSDGQTFRRNSWSALNFSISFYPVTFIQLYQTLITTTHYKNAPLLVEVMYGEQIFKQYFQIDDIDLEGGSITFSSAYPNEGTYWYLGDKVLKRSPVGTRYLTSYENPTGLPITQNQINPNSGNPTGVDNFNNFSIEQSIEQGVIIDIPAGVTGKIGVRNTTQNTWFKLDCDPNTSYRLDTVNLKYYENDVDKTNEYTGQFPSLTPGLTKWCFYWRDSDSTNNYESGDDTLINGLKPNDYASEIEWKWSITYGNFTAGISIN